MKNKKSFVAQFLEELREDIVAELTVYGRSLAVAVILTVVFLICSWGIENFSPIGRGNFLAFYVFFTFFGFFAFAEASAKHKQKIQELQDELNEERAYAE